MISRKPTRIACFAMLSMVCFLFSSLSALYLDSGDALVEKRSSSYSAPLHKASQPDKQAPLEGNETEKEEESRTDRSEHHFIATLHEEFSARLSLTSISRLTYFVRSVETSQTCLPLYLTKRSFLI